KKKEHPAKFWEFLFLSRKFCRFAAILSRSGGGVRHVQTRVPVAAQSQVIFLLFPQSFLSSAL
ncbi:hypothetical protein MTR67_034311, partial [Solanum verrucosum]